MNEKTLTVHVLMPTLLDARPLLARPRRSKEVEILLLRQELAVLRLGVCVPEIRFG